MKLMYDNRSQNISPLSESGQAQFWKEHKKAFYEAGNTPILSHEAIQMQSTWKIHQVVTLGLVHFTPIAKKEILTTWKI